ncbi:MAG: hypothetical protein QXL59_04795 [Candidatus Jordarchaeales archaeon]
MNEKFLLGGGMGALLLVHLKRAVQVACVLFMSDRLLMGKLRGLNLVGCLSV